MKIFRKGIIAAIFLLLSYILVNESFPDYDFGSFIKSSEKDRLNEAWRYISKKKDYKNAIKIYNQVISSHPGTYLELLAMSDKADAYRRMGKIDKSIKIHREIIQKCKEYLDKNPKSIESALRILMELNGYSSLKEYPNVQEKAKKALASGYTPSDLGGNKELYNWFHDYCYGRLADYYDDIRYPGYYQSDNLKKAEEFIPGFSGEVKKANYIGYLIRKYKEKERWGDALRLLQVLKKYAKLQEPHIDIEKKKEYYIYKAGEFAKKGEYAKALDIYKNINSPEDRVTKKVEELKTEAPSELAEFLSFTSYVNEEEIFSKYIPEEQQRLLDKARSLEMSQDYQEAIDIYKSLQNNCPGTLASLLAEYRWPLALADDHGIKGINDPSFEAADNNHRRFLKFPEECDRYISANKEKIDAALGLYLKMIFYNLTQKWEKQIEVVDKLTEYSLNDLYGDKDFYQLIRQWESLKPILNAFKDRDKERARKLVAWLPLEWDGTFYFILRAYFTNTEYDTYRIRQNYDMLKAYQDDPRIPLASRNLITLYGAMTYEQRRSYVKALEMYERVSPKDFLFEIGKKDPEEWLESKIKELSAKISAEKSFWKTENALRKKCKKAAVLLREADKELQDKNYNSVREKSKDAYKILLDIRAEDPDWSHRVVQRRIDKSKELIIAQAEAEDPDWSHRVVQRRIDKSKELIIAQAEAKHPGTGESELANFIEAEAREAEKKQQEASSRGEERTKPKRSRKREKIDDPARAYKEASNYIQEAHKYYKKKDYDNVRLNAKRAYDILGDIENSKPAWKPEAIRKSKEECNDLFYRKIKVGEKRKESKRFKEIDDPESEYKKAEKIIKEAYQYCKAEDYDSLTLRRKVSPAYNILLAIKKIKPDWKPELIQERLDECNELFSKKDKGETTVKERIDAPKIYMQALHSIRSARNAIKDKEYDIACSKIQSARSRLLYLKGKEAGRGYLTSIEPQLEACYRLLNIANNGLENKTKPLKLEYMDRKPSRAKYKAIIKIKTEKRKGDEVDKYNSKRKMEAICLTHGYSESGFADIYAVYKKGLDHAFKNSRINMEEQIKKYSEYRVAKIRVNKYGEVITAKGGSIRGGSVFAQYIEDYFIPIIFTDKPLKINDSWEYEATLPLSGMDDQLVLCRITNKLISIGDPIIRISSKLIGTNKDESECKVNIEAVQEAKIDKRRTIVSRLESEYKIEKNCSEGVRINSSVEAELEVKGIRSYTENTPIPSQNIKNLLKYQELVDKGIYTQELLHKLQDCDKKGSIIGNTSIWLSGKVFDALEAKKLVVDKKIEKNSKEGVAVKVTAADKEPRVAEEDILIYRIPPTPVPSPSPYTKEAGITLAELIDEMEKRAAPVKDIRALCQYRLKMWTDKPVEINFEYQKPGDFRIERGNDPNSLFGNVSVNIINNNRRFRVDFDSRIIQQSEKPDWLFLGWFPHYLLEISMAPRRVMETMPDLSLEGITKLEGEEVYILKFHPTVPSSFKPLMSGQPIFRIAIDRRKLYPRQVEITQPAAFSSWFELNDLINPVGDLWLPRRYETAGVVGFNSCDFRIKEIVVNQGISPDRFKPTFPGEFIVQDSPLKSGEEYEKKLVHDPSDISALYCLAQVYKQDKDYGEAVELLKRAVKIQPAMPAPGKELISLLRERGEYQEAIVLGKQFLKKFPRVSGVYFELVQDYLHLDQPLRAKEYLKKAREEGVNNQSLMKVARLFSEQEMLEDALRIYQDLILDDEVPEHFRLWAINQAVRVATDNVDLDKLISEWKKKASVAGDVFLKKAIADLYQAAGHKDQARELYLNLLKENPDNNSLRLEIAQELCQAKYYEEAEEVLNNLLSQDLNKQKRETVQEELDRIFRKTAPKKEVKERLFRTFIDTGLEPRKRQRAWGMLLNLERRDDSGLEALKLVLRKKTEQDTSDPIFLRALSDIYKAEKNYSRARQYLLKAQEISSRRMDSNDDIAELYRKEGDLEKAAEYYRKASEQSLWAGRYIDDLAEIYIEMGKGGEVENLVRSYLKKSRKNARDYRTAAEIYEKLEKKSEATAYWKKAIEVGLKKDQYRSRLGLAKLYQEMGEEESVRTEIKKILAGKPKSWTRDRAERLLKQIKSPREDPIISAEQFGPRKSEEVKKTSKDEKTASERREIINKIIKLAKKEDPESIEELIKYLDDPNFEVRSFAVQALGKRRAISAFPRLLKLAEEEKDERVLLSVARAISEINPSAGIPVLVKLTGVENENFRSRAYGDLMRLLAPVNTYIKAFSDESSYVRGMIVLCVGDFGQWRPEVKGAVIELLNDENELIRGRAAETLGKRYEYEAIIPLLKLVEARDWQIMDQLVESLSRFNDKRIVEVFDGLWGEKKLHPRIRGMIDNYLKRVRIEGVKDLYISDEIKEELAEKYQTAAILIKKARVALYEHKKEPVWANSKKAFMILKDIKNEYPGWNTQSVRGSIDECKDLFYTKATK